MLITTVNITRLIRCCYNIVVVIRAEVHMEW